MQEYTVRVYDDVTEWYQNGKLHRTDGPAVVYADGDKFWHQNGKLHRTDGPAVECSDGYVEYWENGIGMSDPNETKEMTVAEIAKELGYNVKIVK